jgi:hypothetical protein
MMIQPVHAPALPAWDDESVVPETLILRLYRVGQEAAVNLTVALSPHRRALVAAHCYRRSHLHRLGLAIATTCDRSTLMSVLGIVPGTALFVQSRTLVRAPGDRPKITLAKGRRRPAYLRLVVPEDAAEPPPPISKSGAEQRSNDGIRRDVCSANKRHRDLAAPR